MALKIVYENKESAGPTVKVDQRLYLDAAGRLVGEGDPAAIALYCSAGKRVSRHDFEERGGVVDALVPPEPEPEPEPESTARPKGMPRPRPKPKPRPKKITKKKVAKKKVTKKKGS